jgi:hypothetical protein
VVWTGFEPTISKSGKHCLAQSLLSTNWTDLPPQKGRFVRTGEYSIQLQDITESRFSRYLLGTGMLCVFWYLCRGTGSSKLNLANKCGLDRIRTHNLQITAPNRLAQSLCALPTGLTRLLKKVGLLEQVNRTFNYRTLQKVAYLGIY